ncbi:MAG: hypothetical protein F4062_01660 [Acidimicrobiia bacterium]|nr:hypothetical protein [Acidimicrobiia bacterium]
MSHRVGGLMWGLTRSPAGGLRAETGVVSLFVAVLFVAFLLIAGVVIDSAELRGQRRALADLARQAARAAVQEVDVDFYRLTGTVRLDSGAAVAAARTVAQRSGLEAHVAVQGDRASVSVGRPVAVRVLGLGSGSVQLDASAEARATWGVSAGR